MLFALFTLAACGHSRSQAVSSIQSYLKALVDKKPDQLSTYSCAAWEDQALLELSSFGNVGATLENLQCREAGTNGNYTLVQCQGKIKVDYNGELQELDLGRRTFRSVLEGGQWRMCGYQ